MEGKLPDQQNSGPYFKGEELSFQNKLPPLLVTSFLPQQCLTTFTSELTAAVSHPAECGTCVIPTSETGSWQDALWYLGMHPGHRFILYRIKESYVHGYAYSCKLDKVSE